MHILSQKQQNINGQNKNICLRTATKSLTKIKMTSIKNVISIGSLFSISYHTEVRGVEFDFY